jgi:endonuclease/exonuclease/phosphatase family metal-dependent hydrolase
MKSIFRMAALLVVTACASAGQADRDLITVLVYNIHAGKDAKGVDNLERVAAIIRDSKADVVLLQEVDNGTTRSGKVDQAARLRDLTGFHGAFGKTIDFQGGEYGIAILSRWPIRSDTLIHLPVDSSQIAAGVSHEARGALVAILGTPTGSLRVVNTHLDASRTDSFRIQEARTVIQVAGQQQFVRVVTAPDAWRTLFIGGDFNSEPMSAVHASVISAGWRDAFDECGKGRGLSFPEDRPVKRIDYLFIEGDTRCADARVLDVNASDHRPVVFHLWVKSYRRFSTR